ncbi:MAG: ATPase, central domain protein [Bryobacterales bacterium]|nr:ATPase, central domain protein [Bryobacterales bacterium]
MAREITLTPVQQTAAEELLTALCAGHVLVLRAAAGMGRTTVLRGVHSSAGGAFAGVRQFMDILASRQPAAIEEACLQMIEEALARHDLVIVDDLHMVTSVVDSCNYARSYLLDAALTAIMGGRSTEEKAAVRSRRARCALARSAPRLLMRNRRVYASGL